MYGSQGLVVCRLGPRCLSRGRLYRGHPLDQCPDAAWFDRAELYRQSIQEQIGDEEMRMPKLLFVSILGLLLMGLYGAPLRAQTATPGSGMDMKSMKAQMDQISAQMDQIQAQMKDTMTKMAAADAAMKSHMETEQASMKSQMELQQAIVNYLQAMTDHMQTMKKHMGTMDDQKK
jgi:uncharacterized membrane protein YcgQ (UPF0703/DUF1980 family)